MIQKRRAMAADKAKKEAQEDDKIKEWDAMADSIVAQERIRLLTEHAEILGSYLTNRIATTEEERLIIEQFSKQSDN